MPVVPGGGGTAAATLISPDEALGHDSRVADKSRSRRQSLPEWGRQGTLFVGQPRGAGGCVSAIEVERVKPFDDGGDLGETPRRRSLPAARHCAAFGFWRPPAEGNHTLDQ